MDPLLVVGGIAAVALLMRRTGDAPSQTQAGVSLSQGALTGARSAFRGATIAGLVGGLPADGAFQGRAEAAATSGASGYRGGTSPPRVRSLVGPGQSSWRGRSDGVPLSMGRVVLPWRPARWDGASPLDADLSPVLTVAGKRDAIRWPTDRGVNDADRSYAPTLVFDSDDVCWLADLGVTGELMAGDSSWMGVGFDWHAVRALDAEHQVTGASAEWSRAAWDLDAPRLVQRAGAWVLEGFGAAELAEGQRLNGALSRRWLELVAGASGAAALGAYQGASARTVYQPLIERAKQQLGREAGPGYVAGERTYDALIWSR